MRAMQTTLIDPEPPNVSLKFRNVPAPRVGADSAWCERLTLV